LRANWPCSLEAAARDPLAAGAPLIFRSGAADLRLKSQCEPPITLPVVDLRLCQTLLAGLLKFEQVN
jgi:hypothetical protein